ncbi:MAG: helix-turn-helix transcriptional regulator [Rhodospirillales bacterium]|nr:helix-turn-helix transcriptional regulator [Rhodospirillales bacterium]
MQLSDQISKTSLSPREANVANYLMKGFNAKEIASYEGISVGTVRCHIKSIYPKMGVSSQSQLCGIIIELLLQKKNTQ